MDAVAGGLGILGIIIIAFLIVLAILWFLLPFAVFGIKEHLDRQRAELNMLREDVKTLVKLQKLMVQQMRQQAEQDHIRPDR